jgi:hypothetical protein
MLSSPSFIAANINVPNVNWVPRENLMSNVQGAIIFLDGSWVFPPSWRASVDVVSSDTCVKDREKRDDARAISRMNQWFSPSRRVIAIRPVFTVLCCKIRYPRWIMGCYLYNQENCLIDTTGFQFCYNPFKYIPNHDTIYSYIQPREPSRSLDQYPGKYFWYHHTC